MSLSAKLRHAPLRLSTGAYILNSGIGKLSVDEDSAKGMHGFASGAYPQLQHLDPKTFTRVLAITEIALGGVLLFPLVPPRVAGAGLAGFSGALLGLYWRTPGMHEPGSPRPTQQGVAIAKDTWMLGIGASLMLDSDGGRARAKRKARKAELKAARAEQKAALKAEHKAAPVGKRAERKAEVKTEVKAAARARAHAARGAAKRRAKSARQLAESTTSAAQPYARAARQAMHSAAASAGDTARTAVAAAREAAEAAAGSAAHTARSAASAARS
jgi:hypothetical protein